MNSLSSKLQITNPKQIRHYKFETLNSTVGLFSSWKLVLGVCLGFVILDLGFADKENK